MDKIDITPIVKGFMQLKKEFLIEKAKYYNIPTEKKNKITIAKEIAIAHEKEQTRIWDSISNGNGRKKWS